MKEKKTFCNVCNEYGGFPHHIFETESFYQGMAFYRKKQLNDGGKSK